MIYLRVRILKNRNIALSGSDFCMMEEKIAIAVLKNIRYVFGEVAKIQASVAFSMLMYGVQ